MHQLFAALASLTRGGKRWRGIEIEEVAVAGGGGGSADIIGDREENISGGGEGHGFEDRVQNVSACAPHSSDVHKSAVEGCVSSISNHETSRQSE